MALQLRPDGLLDLVWFWVDGPVTEPGTSQPHGGLLLLGYNPADDSHENAYWVTSGSVTWTSVVSDHLAGTFNLSLQEDPGGAVLDITGGAFNLSLVPEEVIIGDGASFEGPGIAVLFESLREIRRAHR